MARVRIGTWQGHRVGDIEVPLRSTHDPEDVISKQGGGWVAKRMVRVSVNVRFGLGFGFVFSLASLLMMNVLVIVLALVVLVILVMRLIVILVAMVANRNGEETFRGGDESVDESCGSRT